MIVAVDLDGVLFNFMRHWTDRAWHLLDLNIDPGTPQGYDTIHQQIGMTREGFWQWYRRTGGFEDCPLYPGARQQLEQIKNIGHRVILATNRPVWATGQTVQSIKSNRLVHDGFYIGDDKLDINADLWIDDNPKVITAVAELYGPPAVLVIDHPWNADLPEEYTRSRPSQIYTGVTSAGTPEEG